MTKQEVATCLSFFFPGSFTTGTKLKSQDGEKVLGRLVEIEQSPLKLTHANQLLHLIHEAGMTEGFFRYYFLTCPDTHPYPVNRVLDPHPQINDEGISSLKQLEWGLRRLYIDALLFWGNVRSAYRELRTQSHDELVESFKAERFPTGNLCSRGDPLPFKNIPDEDRYLISEIAGTVFQPDATTKKVPMTEWLLDAYKHCGTKEVNTSALIHQIETAHADRKGTLAISCEDIKDNNIASEDDLGKLVEAVKGRFEQARQAASENTRLYLSLTNEMDVYVATSMRTKQQFLEIAKTCRDIFQRDALKKFCLRYFDPTNSIASCNEDKGLIECLMVKCASITLYLAGETDSFGKDAEVAMTLSLGKPSIILCPDTDKGKEREKIFRDVHPLGRLIRFDNGVAVGAMVTRSKNVAVALLQRIVENKMEYDLDHEKKDGYLRLRERLTKSVVRLQTNDRLLRETFWNYYHHVK